MEVTEFMKRPLEGRTVRVNIPVSVANDFGLFKASIGNLLDKLGCRTCFSGADCHFEIIRDWVINEKGEARFVSPKGAKQEIDREGAFGLNEVAPLITARIHPTIANNIDSVFAAIDQIGKHLGCAPCHSGYDLKFQNIVRDFRINEQLGMEF